MTRRPRYVAAAGLVAMLAAFNLATQVRYLAETQSLDNVVLMGRLEQLRTLGPGRPVLLDVTDPTVPGLAAAFTRGHPTAVLAARVFLQIEGFVGQPAPGGLAPQIDGTPLVPVQLREFPIPTSAAGALAFRQVTLQGFSLSDAVLVTSAADQSVLNGSEPRPATGRYYVCNLADVRNHLALIYSSRGQVITPGIIDDIALWQHEPDFANPDGGLQASGRYLLLQVLNPVAGSRLLLDLTASPLAKLGLGLPPAAVIGEHRVELGPIGRGAARLISTPLVPRVIDGRSYIVIDMGADAVRLPYARSGLAGLFNRELGIDPRRVTAFVRNISFLTAGEAEALTPPSGVDRFPAGLFAPGLQFSGVYEDGWMAEAARFRLRVPAGSRGVRLAGHMPNLGTLRAGAGMTLLVDGEPVLQRRLEPGDFTLRADLPPSQDARWIDIRLDTTERLPGGDGRVASVLLRVIALEGGP